MREFLANTVSRVGGRGFVLFLGLLAIAVYAIWLLSADARRQLNTLATAPGDNLQWTLAQLEVEYAAMQRAALLATPDRPQTLSTLRRRFDVFYSRATIFSSARAFDPVLADPEVEAAMGRVRAFLDEFVVLVDGSDADLADRLPDFYANTEALSSDIRAIALTGVRVYSAISERNRESAAAAMFDLAALILFLIFLLSGLVIVLAYVLAITRRQTDEIEQTRSRLESIVGTSLDGVVAVDRQSRIVELNPAAERIFGYTREEALGQPMADLIIPEDDRDAHNRGMARFLKTGEKRMIDAGLVQMRAMRRDGSQFPVELSISTAESAEGELYISFIRDISNRIESEKQLVEARDRAVLGEQAKANLLAVMSHEMRTPLNGILGTLDLLEDTDLDARQRHFVEVMEGSGEMLLRHVNDVLDVSRMDAEMPEPTRQPFDLADTIQSVAASLRGQAEARGNVIVFEVLGDFPASVSGDKRLIEQVLVNLVGNAIKFTEKGAITIEVEASPGSNEVEMRVIDTGIGIAEEDQSRIFDDFFTLDASYTRSTEGTGLGLGITQRLVEAHGGRIGVESDLGAGSVFWVCLELPAVSDAPRSDDTDSDAPMSANAQGKRVLIVEDNATNRMVAREMSIGFGGHVEEAVDGADGVERAATAPFDLILMDINMPRLDGISAAERIRETSGPNQKTPIVAMTAHALPEDIKRFRSAGFRDVLVKPLTRQRLATVLAGSFTTNGPSSDVVGSAAELDAVLGGAEAARLRGEAISEISATLDKVERLLKTTTDADEIGDIVHRATGLAALVGLDEAHGGLLALASDPSPHAADRVIAQIRAALAEPVLQG